MYKNTFAIYKILLTSIKIQKRGTINIFPRFLVAKTDGMWYSVGYISYKEEEKV